MLVRMHLFVSSYITSTWSYSDCPPQAFLFLSGRWVKSQWIRSQVPNPVNPTDTQSRMGLRNGDQEPDTPRVEVQAGVPASSTTGNDDQLQAWHKTASSWISIVFIQWSTTLQCHLGILGGSHYVSFAKNEKCYYFNDSLCKFSWLVQSINCSSRVSRQCLHSITCSWILLVCGCRLYTEVQDVNFMHPVENLVLPKVSPSSLWCCYVAMSTKDHGGEGWVLQESAYMVFLHWALGPTERPVSGKEIGKKQDIGRAKDIQEFEEKCWNKV